jgi:hypothetical protein
MGLEERCSDIKEIKDDFRICPEGHFIPYVRWNYARDFSDGDVDSMTMFPMFEVGLYCLGCERAYGISKLDEPEKTVIIFDTYLDLEKA